MGVVAELHEHVSLMFELLIVRRSQTLDGKITTGELPYVSKSLLSKTGCH